MADYFEKRHTNVLRDIRELNCSAEFTQLNFEPFKIDDLTGHSTSHVMMTKDGFAFLATGFTGAKALVFKLAYIMLPRAGAASKLSWAGMECERLLTHASDASKLFIS